jgi:hypothetical protein
VGRPAACQQAARPRPQMGRTSARPRSPGPAWPPALGGPARSRPHRRLGRSHAKLVWARLPRLPALGMDRSSGFARMRQGGRPLSFTCAAPMIDKGISSGPTHFGQPKRSNRSVWVGSRTEKASRLASVRLGRAVHPATLPIFWTKPVKPIFWAALPLSGRSH